MAWTWTATELDRTDGSRDGHSITPYLWHAYADDPEKRQLVLAHQQVSLPYTDSYGYEEEDNGCPTCGFYSYKPACDALQELAQPFITEGKDSEWIASTLWSRIGAPEPEPYDGPRITIANKIVYGRPSRGTSLENCIIRAGAEFRTEDLPT